MICLIVCRYHFLKYKNNNNNININTYINNGENMKKIAIIGSGSWGLALGKYLVEQGHQVKVWSYSRDEADNLNNNQKSIYLPNIVFPKDLRAYTDFEDVIKNSEYIFHVTPSIFTRSTVKEYKKYVKPNQPIIICSKGFEKETKMTLEEVIQEELPNNLIAVFSGPSHAEEVSMNIPTLMVVASKDDILLDEIVDLFQGKLMRIYKTHDIIGVGLGGALKNILAFSAGTVTGLGYGDNTFAAMVTRGLVELSRLSKAMGADPYTIYGLSGLGDLIVTCMSEHSRNRRAGILLAKGYSIPEIKEEIGQTIESIDNIEATYLIAKELDVELPIVNVIYDILFNNLNPKDAMNMLMLRDSRFEQNY